MTRLLPHSALGSQPGQRQGRGAEGAGSPAGAFARHTQGNVGDPVSPCLGICFSGDRKPWTAGGSGPPCDPPFPLERVTGPRMKCQEEEWSAQPADRSACACRSKGRPVSAACLQHRSAGHHQDPVSMIIWPTMNSGLLGFLSFNTTGLS